MGERVGVLGGTFDPIHIGHLILAEEAHYQLPLDALYLLPAGDPPHKQAQSITPVEHRLHMLELAIADIDYAHVSLIDVNRPGPHYTVDTIQLLHAELGPQADIYFLMGMDSLRDLPTWHNPQWLVDNCRLVALNRPDVAIDWPTLEAALPSIRHRVIMLDMPEVEIASSTLRARVRRGAPIRFQVPQGIEIYIAEHALYR